MASCDLCLRHQRSRVSMRLWTAVYRETTDNRPPFRGDKRVFERGGSASPRARHGRGSRGLVPLRVRRLILPPASSLRSSAVPPEGGTEAFASPVRGHTLTTGVSCELGRDSEGVGGDGGLFRARGDGGPGCHLLAYVTPKGRGRGRPAWSEVSEPPMKRRWWIAFCPSSNGPPLCTCMVAGRRTNVNPYLGNRVHRRPGPTETIQNAKERLSTRASRSLSIGLNPLAAFLDDVGKSRRVDLDSWSHRR